MRVNILTTFLTLLIVPFAINAQSPYVPLNNDVYHLIDRYEIRSGKFADEFYSAYKPYKRSAVIDLVKDIKDSTDLELSKTDKFNLQYLEVDNWQYLDSSGVEMSEKPIFKHFYKTKSDIYSVDKDGLKLRFNPVMYLGAGRDNTYNGNLFINTRGIAVEGSIDDKVSFYTFMTDNQMIAPNYVEEYVDAHQILPGEGFHKRIGGADNTNDFLTARGYINFKILKHIDFQFGHDKQFIGNGYRSLILSDFSNNYLFMKLNTQIWKFKYTNLFTEMNSEVKGIGGDRVLNKKYLALHHLSLNVTKNFNLGIFEANPYGRDNGSVELQYLNPIIFYRSVEQQIGSNDNAIIGADFKYNFLNHFSAYGQVVIDELLIGNLRSNRGSWTNKQAVQLGLKYVDAFGISNLDLQVERNYIRPFVYSHKDMYRNYTHYNQELAHPMGANLREVILMGRYQPIPRLELKGRIMMVTFGQDTGSTNYGNDVRIDYTRHGSDNGHFTAERIRTDLTKIDLTATYQVKQNIFLDLSLTKRTTSSALARFNSDATIMSGALRWNIRERRHDF